MQNLQKRFRYFTLLVQIVSALLLFTSLAAFFNRSNQLAEFAVSFRPIYFYLAIIIILLGIVLRDRRVMVLCALAALLNGAIIAPYWELDSGTVVAADMRVMLFNVDRQVLPWVGPDHIPPLVRQHNPTIAVLTEMGEAESQVVREALADRYPFSHAHFDAPTDGTLILSQIELTRQDVMRLGRGRKVPVVEFTVKGQTVVLIAPHPTNALYDFGERNDQLAAIAEHVATVDRPLILAGDLNVTPWSRWFGAIERAGVRSVRRGQGILPSWQTPIPGLRLPIDHVMTSAEFNTINLFLGAKQSSDHYPMIVDLQFGG